MFTMRSSFSAQVFVLAILLGLSLPAQAQEQISEQAPNPGSEQQLKASSHPYSIELSGGFMVYPVSGPVGNLRLSYALFPELELALQAGVLSSNGPRNEAPNAISGYGALEGRLYTTGLASVLRPFVYLSLGLMTPVPGSLGWPLPYLAGGGGVLWQISEHFGASGVLETGAYSYLTPRLALRYSF